MFNLKQRSDQYGDRHVAIFHDNFAQDGGAERVAEELHRILIKQSPSTQLLSTLSAEERLSPYLRTANIRNTWMQWLPARGRLFRAYFLLYPFAIDHVDLSEFSLVVSSCFGYAKGIRRRPNALHICYCHTPMRWIWRRQDYLARENNSSIKGLLLAFPLRWLKSWELRAAARPDFYIANSSTVAIRLFKAFGVNATVIHPPIDTARFAPPPGVLIDKPENFYLVLSRLVPYKRFDLAIEACTRTKRRLIVIGDGPDRARLEAMAGPTVTFLGRASNEIVNDHARRCRALLFPGEEDFGMTPLEVNAAGRPVVAYRAGGAMETIKEGVNGIFFDTPDANALIAAIDRLESKVWDEEEIQQHAQGFDRSVFEQRITEFIQQALESHTSSEAGEGAWVSR